MFAHFGPSVLAVAATISRQADDLCNRINGDVADEDDFTSRLADRIERAVNNAALDGIHWHARARKLQWRGKRSEEPRVGADLALVLRMSGRDFDVRKGYLIQGKLVRNLSLDCGVRSPFGQNDRVTGQCKRMLGVTPESYLWFYTPSGVSVLRAGTVLGVEPSTVHLVERRSLYEFFLTGFRSWSGDPRLGDISKESIEVLARAYEVPHALEVHAVDEVADRPT